MLLEVIQRRNGHLQASLILALGTFQARQSAGDSSIDFQFLWCIHIVHDGQTLGPVEFGHTLLMGTVAGIPQPVESLAFADIACFLQTVGQHCDTLVVLRLIGDVDQTVGFLLVLSIRRTVDVTTCSGQQHADN